jgi:DUF438 domain-containing protein
MSEFTNHSEKRSRALTNYMSGLIAGKNGTEMLKQYNILTDNYIPSDILPVFNNLFRMGFDIGKIKTASDKLFNILYKPFNNYPSADIQSKSYLSYLIADNSEIKIRLEKIKPNLKKINKTIDNHTISALKEQFTELSKINIHYISKENILFPHFENFIKHSDCLKVMWSYHDSIKKNIKLCINLLSENNFDLKEFNKISAKVFFNINTIIFREEKVIFPIISESFNKKTLNSMLSENKEIGFSFINSNSIEYEISQENIFDENKTVNFETGTLNLKQLELIFRHLPIDISYVDETDTVQFYSDPPHRIFPRTKSIIGRKVQNCHPPESIDVVNKIISAFKSEEKNVASFWIQLNEKYILINYYAVRDSVGKYCGTLEVSQDISDIRNISGEKRLLDWGKI